MVETPNFPLSGNLGTLPQELMVKMNDIQKNTFWGLLLFKNEMVPIWLQVFLGQV